MCLNDTHELIRQENGKLGEGHRDKYFDFNLTHTIEKLREVESIQIGLETLRRWYQEEGFSKKYKLRSRAGKILFSSMWPKGLYFLKMNSCYKLKMENIQIMS